MPRYSDSVAQKKQGLGASDMSNYRPVSNLSYISKVVERAVAIRLNDYLVANDLLPRVQSAYRKRHSTETTLLRVWSDIDGCRSEASNITGSPRYVCCLRLR